jgi:hypothetical protein
LFIEKSVYLCRELKKCLKENGIDVTKCYIIPTFSSVDETHKDRGAWKEIEEGKME